MSVQRSFAQRNNNVVNLAPGEKVTSGTWNNTYLLNIDPRNGSVFKVDLTGLDTIDNDLNNVDVFGKLRNEEDIPVVYFAVIIDPTIATAYPGLEFTVNFLRGDQNANTCVDVYPDATLTESYKADLLSPQRGFDLFNIQSLTMKSDGERFNVISSGPVMWSAGYRWD